jgi:hypothetical protein
MKVNEYLPNLDVKVPVDLMHWNISIGPEKWPIFISIKTSHAARKKCLQHGGDVMDDVTCSITVQHILPLRPVCLSADWSCTKTCRYFPSFGLLGTSGTSHLEGCPSLLDLSANIKYLILTHSFKKWSLTWFSETTQSGHMMAIWPINCQCLLLFMFTNLVGLL